MFIERMYIKHLQIYRHLSLFMYFIHTLANQLETKDNNLLHHLLHR